MITHETEGNSGQDVIKGWVVQNWQRSDQGLLEAVCKGQCLEPFQTPPLTPRANSEGGGMDFHKMPLGGAVMMWNPWLVGTLRGKTFAAPLAKRTMCACVPERIRVCVARALNCVRLLAIPRSVAHRAPLSVGFSHKNTGVGCHFLLQVDLPDPGIEPASPLSPPLAGRFFNSEPPGNH